MTSGNVLTPVLAIGFVLPWLMAAGAAATSIPIIIHLLNKRKFRVVVWAAMEFLMAAQKRNARRLRFQRWLLLALRCLAILVIAAGIAQLILQSKTFGNLLAGEQRSVIVLWDDSYSMAYHGEGAGREDGTAFERSRRLISEYVGRLKPADKVLVLRASRLAALENLEARPTLDHAGVLSQIAAARVGDAGTDLPAAFDQATTVLKDLEAVTRTRQVLLFTDFSRSSIFTAVGSGGTAASGAGGRVAESQGDRLKKAADAMRSHATEFRVFNVGDAGQSNMAVTEIRSRRPAVVAGAPGEFEVTVLNGTDVPKNDVALTVLVDGVPTQTERLPKIDAGTPLTTTVRVTIPSVGRHLIEARLPADGLPTDDSRRLLVNVLQNVQILLVDGNPGDGGKTSYGSTAYLWAAYAFPADNKPASAFAPRTITELELPTTPLAGYSVVVLSDVGEPAPAVRENLKKFVEGGGLLMVFPGNRMNTQRINDTLGEAGAKLLPAVLGQPVGNTGGAGGTGGADAAANGMIFAPEGYTHPVLSVFAADYKAGKEVGFATVQTTRYLKLGVPADDSTETVLRYANANGTPGDPAVVMKSVGKGRVILFASTSDMAWNTWGAKPSFLPFLHELTYYGMGRELAGGTLTLRLGQRLHLPAEAAASGAWVAPRDARINVTSEIDRDGRAFLNSPPLVAAGTYAPAASTDGRPVIAVNPDADEADIRAVAKPQMAAALGIDPTLITERPGTIVEAGERAVDDSHSLLGITLIAIALGLFVMESVCAMLFSTYR